ncbi:hypothetical protein V6N13_046004 [Hibiscus sabdariffa]|uniref:Uncharacterized protein n=2 Tax=Hibiscus sabdariffa TaxID=183260 RepID=A0ABR2A4A3_9ROSI
MRVSAIAVTFNPFTSPATPKLTQTRPSFPSPLKLTTPENQQLSCNHLTHSNSDQLAKNWVEYQGSNNWEGLLDPLDHILRNEILSYGHFVEAAYRACDFDASSPSFGSCKFSKNSLLTRACIPRTCVRRAGFSYRIGLTGGRAGFSLGRAGSGTWRSVWTKRRSPDSEGVMWPSLSGVPPRAWSGSRIYGPR